MKFLRRILGTKPPAPASEYMGLTGEELKARLVAINERLVNIVEVAERETATAAVSVVCGHDSPARV